MLLILSENIFAQTQTSVQGTSPAELSKIIKTQRQNNENEIKNTLNEIDELISTGFFDKAADKFKIIKKEYKNRGKTSYTESKLKELKLKENYFYKKWSDNLETQAETAYHNNKWNDSIKLANESIDLLKKSSSNSPLNTVKQEKIIKTSKNQIVKSKFHEEIALSTLIPGHKKDKSDIDMFFFKAETFINNKQYDKARDFLERILVIDPYNFKAMYMLKNLYGKLFKVAKNRTNVEFRDKMAEVRWDYSQQISPELTRSGEQLTKVIIADKGNNKIRDKLQNIIIEKVDFDDATISSVITYLNRESKRLDKTDGAGINIVLRLVNSTEDNLESITMSMDEIPFEEALKYICLATGLKYRIEEHAIIIGDESIEELKTEFFTIETDLINSIASDVKVETEEDFSDSDSDLMNPQDFGKEEAVTIDLTMDKLRTYFTNRGVPFPEGSTIAWDARANTLTATNTPENLRILEKLLKEIDIKVPLVLIETKFVEINETDLKEFGFDWKASFDSGTLLDGAKWGINQFQNNTNIVQPKTTTTKPGNDSILKYYDYNPNLATSTTNSSQGALIKNLTFNLPYAGSDRAGSLSFWLYALDQSNIAEILSAPKVITKSGTTALIRMVEEEYFPLSWTKPDVSTPSTSSEISQTSTVQINQTTPEFGEATDYGIRLEVTPTVSPNNYTILLELKPERSDFTGWTDYTYNIETWQGVTNNVAQNQVLYTQPVKMSEIDIRKVKTTVMVYDGSTTVLGGMIKDETTSSDDIIPILGEIPIVGRLFRSEYTRSVKKNLLIFVTARLIKPDGTPFRKTFDNGLFDFGQY